MTLNETVDMLKSLKLNGMAESYNEMMNLPINMRPSLVRASTANPLSGSWASASSMADSAASLASPTALNSSGVTVLGSAS